MSADGAMPERVAKLLDTPKPGFSQLVIAGRVVMSIPSDHPQKQFFCDVIELSYAIGHAKALSTLFFPKSQQ